MTTGIARLSGNCRQIIKVNFDNLRADGRLIVHSRRFFPVQPEMGARVFAVDEAGDKDLEFGGTVTGFSDDGQRVWVTMDWADDPYDETDTTVEEFDKMWDESEPA